MSFYTASAYENYGKMATSYVPFLRSFAESVQGTFPDTANLAAVDLGAGSGVIANALSKMGRLEVTAVDSSPHSLAKLENQVKPVRRDIGNTGIVGPIHAIHAKDLFLSTLPLQELFTTIAPWVIQNTLFMLTYFIDTPGAWLTDEYARRAGWDTVGQGRWMPNAHEINADWYKEFPALRVIKILQYTG